MHTFSEIDSHAVVRPDPPAISSSAVPRTLPQPRELEEIQANISKIPSIASKCMQTTSAEDHTIRLKTLNPLDFEPPASSVSESHFPIRVPDLKDLAREYIPEIRLCLTASDVEIFPVSQLPQSVVLSDESHQTAPPDADAGSASQENTSQGSLSARSELTSRHFVHENSDKGNVTSVDPGSHARGGHSATSTAKSKPSNRAQDSSLKRELFLALAAPGVGHPKPSSLESLEHSETKPKPHHSTSIQERCKQSNTSNIGTSTSQSSGADSSNLKRKRTQSFCSSNSKFVDSSLRYP